ncbi:hypothetical protein GXW82_09035 [Streptacidiphilus sp. 4-A2]|nr:hypothetical protein [Streptacidiphilus sp. 4-A2]
MPPAVILVDPELPVPESFFAQFAGSVENLADELTEDELAQSLARGRQAVDSADPAEACATLTGLYQELSLLAFTRAELGPELAAEAAERFDRFLAYLLAASRSTTPLRARHTSPSPPPSPVPPRATPSSTSPSTYPAWTCCATPAWARPCPNCCVPTRSPRPPRRPEMPQLNASEQNTLAVDVRDLRGVSTRPGGGAARAPAGPRWTR